MKILLWLMRGRDSLERQAIQDDAAQLLDAARARGVGAFAATWLALMWDLLIVGAGCDLARAIQSLVRAPGFTVTVSLLLGLGVAATTTLFALVYAVVLKPLPYGDPDQLVMVWESNPSQGRLREGPSPGSVDDWAEHNETFEAITAWWTVSATLRGLDGSAPVSFLPIVRHTLPPNGGQALSGEWGPPVSG